MAEFLRHVHFNIIIVIFFFLASTRRIKNILQYRAVCVGARLQTSDYPLHHLRIRGNLSLSRAILNVIKHNFECELGPPA